MNAVEKAVLGGQAYVCIQAFRVKKATYET